MTGSKRPLNRILSRSERTLDVLRVETPVYSECLRTRNEHTPLCNNRKEMCFND